MYKKTILAGTMVFLLIGVAMLPASAKTTLVEDLRRQETTVIEQFMNDVERIASESQSFTDFAQKLQNLLLTKNYGKFPIVHEIFSKIVQFLTKTQSSSIAGLNILNLLGKSSSLRLISRSFFVLSYGAYHRLNPRKENSINRFKERLSMWRYSDAARLLKGKTLILERHPFGIHQRVIGPQLGIMRGFKGIYLDIESKLTGNAYVFFIGSARRIHAFDLTPFSK
ncbi:MAG: hypothetical protein JW840_02810 [Candidatus Thermoplasmatota archaeon]|nr:hypothetical protein [Candidatus Thermoplasmatota archaeon]